MEVPCTRIVLAIREMRLRSDTRDVFLTNGCCSSMKFLSYASMSGVKRGGLVWVFGVGMLLLLALALWLMRCGGRVCGHVVYALVNLTTLETNSARDLSYIMLASLLFLPFHSLLTPLHE